MGYWVYQREVRFRLAQRYHAVALAATKSLTGSYSWVETERVLAATSLLEAFAAWRWHPETDHQGTITNIYHTGWKIGDYLQFFEAIAPWVEIGSFVRLEGEDGAVWHYAFDGLHAREIREHPDEETSWRAVGAHSAFVAEYRGLAERLAGPVSALVDGTAMTPADGAALAAADLDKARQWLHDVLAQRARGVDPGDRALQVALRALPLFTVLPTWSSWRMSDLVLLVADAWGARLHEAALAGTPERTASLGAMLAPLFAHPDLAACWTTVLQQLLATRDGHHVRLAAGNVIANLGMAAPVTLCTDLLTTPYAAGARIAALLAVWPHRERVDPQTILPALSDPDATVVVFAIELLGGMGARMPREPLMALRTAPDSVGGAALYHTTAPDQEDDLSADQQRQLRVYRYLRQNLQGRGGPYWPATTLTESRAHRDQQDRVRAWHIAALPDNGVTDADLTAIEPGRSGALLLPALLTRPVTHLPPPWIPVLTYAQPQSSEGRRNVTWAQTYGDRPTFSHLLDIVRAGPPVDPAPWSTAPSQIATNFLAAVGAAVPVDLVAPLLDDPRAPVRAAALRILGPRLPLPRLLGALQELDDDLRQAALRVAASHPDLAEWDTISALAQHTTGATQTLALHALNRFSARLETAILAAYLGSDDLSLRTFAAGIAAKRADPASLDLLVTALSAEQAQGESTVVGQAVFQRAGELTDALIARLPPAWAQEWQITTRRAQMQPDDTLAHDALFLAFFGVVAEDDGLAETARTLAPLIATQPDLFARVAAMLASALPARRHAAFSLLQHVKTATATALLGDALSHLEHPDQRVTRPLRDRGIPLPAAVLIPALTTNVDESREDIAAMLGESGDAVAVEPLLAALRLPGRYGHEGSERALLALQAHIPDERIVQLAESSSSWQRAMAMTFAGQRSTVPQALLLAGLDDLSTRIAALTALMARGEPFPADLVAPYVTDPSPWVRTHAIAALAVLGAACPPEPIVVALGDRDPYNTIFTAALTAITALPTLRRQTAVAALTYVGDEQPTAWLGVGSRCASTAALPRFLTTDPAAWDDLLTSLRWPHWQVRLLAVHTVQALVTEITTPAIFSAPMERATAGDNTHLLHADRALPAAIVHAIATLRHDDEAATVRHAAARTLDAIIGSGFGSLLPAGA